MATPQDRIRQEILRLADQQVGTGEGEVDPIREELGRLLMERGMGQEAPPGTGRGFFERVGRAVVPGSREDIGIMAAGAVSSAFLDPARALAQIPGLFTEAELPTDRAARFLERFQVGILTKAEEAALDAGMDPQGVADAHLFGEIVGFTAPVLGALKVARLALGARGSDLTLRRLFTVDATAGLIFGSALSPADAIRERLENTLRESAIFGVGSLVIGGPLMAIQGFRGSRRFQGQLRKKLQEDLDRIARGERVVFDGDDGIALADLMTEEGYLAASPEAQNFLREFEFEQALVAGIRDWAESGMSRGFVREIGTDFATVQGQLTRFREQFPHLKFDLVKREGLFDLHFGMQGLSNPQKAQLKREGRFAGQLIQKGDSFYQYVRQGKGDRLVVSTVDGKTTTITPKGVTDLPAGSEDIALPTAGQAMYESYRQFVFDRMTKAAGMSGGVSEEDLIRFAREGQLPDLEGARLFESSGAITHQSELGRFPDGRKYQIAPHQGNSFLIQDVDGRSIGQFWGQVDESGIFTVDDIGLINPDMPEGLSSTDPFTFFSVGDLRALGRDLIEAFSSQGVEIQAISGLRAGGMSPDRVASLPAEFFMRGGTRPEDFVQGFLREGKQSGDLLQSEPLQNLDDAFDAWIRESGLSGRKFEARPVRPEGELLGNEHAFSVVDIDGNEAGFIVGEMLDDVFRITDMAAASNQPGTFGTGNMRDIGRSIVEQLQARGISVRAITGGRASGTQPGRVAGIDVEDLMRGRDELRDLPAARAFFNRQLREDIWKLAPDDELERLAGIREETIRLLDEQDLPFEVAAGTKGFHVERSATGEVTLRDINTGARMEFANEEVANRALERIVRTEKDPLPGFVTPGPHGGSAFTTGYDPTDGVFTLDKTNIAPEEMLLKAPTQAFTNVMDYMDALEGIAKIPVFSEGFQRIDNAVLRSSQRYGPQSEEIASIWKGINRDRRKAVAEFWVQVEGTDLSGAALNRAAREAGLSSQEIRALGRAQNMMGLGAEQLGLPESRFISNYYSRIRQMYEEGISQSEMLRRLSDDPVLLREYRFWAEMPRTGDLPQIELDPEIVMHKYFKGLAYKLEVAPLEEQFKTMINTRIRDLAPSAKAQVMQRALPDTSPNSFVFPTPVRDFLKEYINSIRGDMNPGFASARRMFTKMSEGLGMKVDPKVVDQLHSTYLSMQYGAGIGLRLMLMNRNAVQNLWTMYTRVGGKHGPEAMRLAMDLNGFGEAVEALAVRQIQASVPFHDAVFNSWFESGIAQGTGPVSNALASALRKAIRLGQVTRKTAEKFLIPYGSGDQVNRAIAYHWQKLHTQDWLGRFQAGRIDWDRFVEEGLPFFSDNVKRGFRQRYDHLGAEEALRYIGKQAADEAHFIYGSASAPPWMQRPFGRLFGVFGQWPLWAKQLYINRMANATPGQVAKFWTRTAALTGMFANMSIQSGVSMWNWIAPSSLGFTGGPFTEVAIQGREVIDSPLDQKAAALKRLATEVGGMLLPGQIFWRDITTSMDATDPRQAALLLSLGRPADQVNFNFDIVLDPDSQGFITPPESRLPMIEGLPPLSR